MGKVVQFTSNYFELSYCVLHQIVTCKKRYNPMSEHVLFYVTCRLNFQRYISLFLYEKMNYMDIKDNCLMSKEKAKLEKLICVKSCSMYKQLFYIKW